MKISKASVYPFTASFFEKIKKFDPLFNTGLDNFFKTKTYGKGVEEILYKKFIVRDDLSKEPKLAYVPDKKTIVCIINPDYNKAIKCSVNTYGKLMAAYYLEMSDRFSELAIEDFDFTTYAIDLKFYLKEHQLL